MGKDDRLWHSSVWQANKSLDSVMTAAIYARVSADDGLQSVTSQVEPAATPPPSCRFLQGQGCCVTIQHESLPGVN